MTPTMNTDPSPLNADLLRTPARLRTAVKEALAIIDRVRPDVVVGFGATASSGLESTPPWAATPPRRHRTARTPPRTAVIIQPEARADPRGETRSQRWRWAKNRGSSGWAVRDGHAAIPRSRLTRAVHQHVLPQKLMPRLIVLFANVLFDDPASPSPSQSKFPKLLLASAASAGVQSRLRAVHAMSALS